MAQIIRCIHFSRSRVLLTVKEINAGNADPEDFLENNGL